eukprot:scaffold2939_cov406-Prasinococcus_capsulatus_cf.AAC.14
MIRTWKASSRHTTCISCVSKVLMGSSSSFSEGPTRPRASSILRCSSFFISSTSSRPASSEFLPRVYQKMSRFFCHRPTLACGQKRQSSLNTTPTGTRGTAGTGAAAPCRASTLSE